MVLEIVGRWLHNSCFVECCFRIRSKQLVIFMWSSCQALYIYIYTDRHTHIYTRIAIYIYIYIYINWNKRKRWQYRLKLPKLCYHPGWRLMRLVYRTCFHTLYDEKKKKKYIYIYIYIYYMVASVTLGFMVYAFIILCLVNAESMKFGVTDTTK